MPCWTIAQSNVVVSFSSALEPLLHNNGARCDKRSNWIPEWLLALHLAFKWLEWTWWKMYILVETRRAKTLATFYVVVSALDHVEYAPAGTCGPSLHLVFE